MKKYQEIIGDESLSEAFLPESASASARNTNNISRVGEGVGEDGLVSTLTSTNIVSESASFGGTSAVSGVSGFQRIITLYDAESMLEMKASVAAGYVTLLNSNRTSTVPVTVPCPEQAKTQQQGKKKQSHGQEQEQGQQQQQQISQPCDEDFISLAFLSIVEGNVIDACFGVRTGVLTSTRTSTQPATANTSTSTAVTVSTGGTKQAKNTIHERLVKDAKCIIQDAVDNDESIRYQCINTYKHAFQIIVDTNIKLNKLNILTRCYRYKKIRNDAIQSLQSSFTSLEQLLQRTIQS